MVYLNVAGSTEPQTQAAAASPSKAQPIVVIIVAKE